MKKDFEMPKGFVPQLQYVILIPLFFIIFILIYKPFYMIESLSGLGGRTEYFHLLMMASVVLVTLAIDRLIFTAINRAIKISMLYYLLWCLFEIVTVSLFMALYLSLFAHQPYFLSLSYSLKYSSLTLIFPYIFLILRRAIVIRDNCLEESIKPKSSSLFKFYDEHKRVKFTIDPHFLVYIAAESNYIKLCYLENDKIKEFLLRASMKSLEESAPKNGLVRCHRSYYINPQYVKVLGRNKSGVIVAELLDGTHQVPVSKQYYESLTSLL